MEDLFEPLPDLDQLPLLAQAIHYQKPITHLLQLIQNGANVNEEVVCYPYHHYVTHLLVFTVYRYGSTSNILINSLMYPHNFSHLRYLSDVLYLLLDHGADPSCFLPFHDHLIPFLHNDPALLPYMIERGLIITVQGKREKTILHRSVEHLTYWIEDPDKMGERLAVIHQLLDLGVDPDLQDREGETVLHCLLRLPITPPLFRLLQRLLPMVDVNREDNQGDTPLHHYLLTYPSNRRIHTIPRQQVIDLLTSKGVENPFPVS